MSRPWVRVPPPALPSRERRRDGGKDDRPAAKTSDIRVEQLAERVGKQVDHVEAVLDGYPNSTQRPTQLDTVDEIAGALGLKLDLTVVDPGNLGS